MPALSSGLASIGGGRDSKATQEEALSKLASPLGDHLTLLNIYDAFLEAGKTAEWCQEQFLNHRSLIRYCTPKQ